MGGRGAAGKWKTVSNGGGGKAPPFHEIKSLEGLTVREFEDKIRTSEQEYVGLVNKQGVVYLAGTSYRKGSVGIPVGHPDFKKIRWSYAQSSILRGSNDRSDFFRCGC